MTRALTALALALVPNLAHAGWGVSGSFGGGKYTTTAPYVSPFGLPTIDIVADKTFIQIHALELLDGISRDPTEIKLGGSFYQQTFGRKINDDVFGVVQPGAALELYLIPNAESTNGVIAFEPRFGVQARDKFGAGLYVVPSAGLGFIDLGDTELELVLGGEIQLSVWID